MLLRSSVATLLVAAVTSVGCSSDRLTTGSAGTTPSTGFLDAGGLDGEYQAELSRLEFPPDMRAPARAPAEQSGAVYEPGLGTSSADFAWLCAWFAEFMVQRTRNQARATHALSVLDGFPKLELWGQMDPGGRQTIVEAIAKARTGDPKAIVDQQDAMMCHR
jgi:hypothetical protein